MITEWVINAVVGVLTGILSLVPEWQVPATAHAFGGTLGNLLGWANGYFPIMHLGICIGIYLAARLAFSVFAVLRWVYDRIPLKAT